MSSLSPMMSLVKVVVAVSVAGAWVAVSQLSAVAQPGGYADVPEDAYYSAPVADLAGGGVFDSTGCDDGFCPGEAIDRKTMAVWVVRILDGSEPPATASRFNDVDADSFYAPFIERMAELGVTGGCGDGSGFCPDRAVTRAQMAVFLTRAYDLPDGADPGFSDVPSDAWYAAGVASLAASGITAGCGDGSMFCPGRDTTRAQMATFLWRAENPARQSQDEPASTPVALNAAMSGGGVIANECAIRSDGALVCWGGEEEIVREGSFKAVNSDAPHTCAIRADDTVECWDYGGPLGAPPGALAAVTTAVAYFPVDENLFPEYLSCGIRLDGTLTCWLSLEDGGYSDTPECEEVSFEHADFGEIRFTSCSPAILITPEGVFTAISRACAIAVDGTINCWHAYFDFDNVEIHGPPPDGGTYKALSLGYTHSCAIRTDDTLTCWGRNEHGQLESPEGQFKAVSSGYSHSCAIRMDNTVTCWGRNEAGQSDAPAGEFIAVSAGNGSPCAIGADNTLTCWGIGYGPDWKDPRRPPEGSFGPS